MLTEPTTFFFSSMVRSGVAIIEDGVVSNPKIHWPWVRKQWELASDEETIQCVLISEASSFVARGNRQSPQLLAPLQMESIDNIHPTILSVPELAFAVLDCAPLQLVLLAATLGSESSDVIFNAAEDTSTVAAGGTSTVALAAENTSTVRQGTIEGV
jgi:hypothetical protein